MFLMYLHRLVLVLLCTFFVASCASTKASRSNMPERASRILDVAESLQGTTYCAAGATPECFYCSGFVSYCFAKVGISLPRTSQAMYHAGVAVDKQILQSCDIVFFRTNSNGIGHVGIMIDTERFIHASTTRGVIISPLVDSYWAPRFVGGRRIIQP